MAGERDEMTLAELLEIGRRLAPVDPSTVPAGALGRVAVHNRRVVMLEALLRRAHRTLEAGARIEPEFASTVRFAATALQHSRARLLEDLEPPDA